MSKRGAVICESLFPDEEIPVKVEEARCAYGDVWALGEHRLICGDSTDEDAVRRFLGGRRPALGFADPPYGAKVAEWDTEFVWGHDYLSGLCDVVAVTPGIGSVSQFFTKTRMPYRWSLATWITNGHSRSAIGFGNWMYTAVFSEGGVYRCAQDFSRVETVPGGTGSVHPGQKPPRYMKWILDLFSQPGEVVLDVFGGSGTTLIAAEGGGRVCFMVEVRPEFADVTLRRYERTTGKKVERVFP